MKALPTMDLDHVFEKSRADWETLGGKRFFITGGSGFVGRWLLETLLDASVRLRLPIRVDTMTRDAAAFIASAPHLARHPSLKVHEGGFSLLREVEGKYDFVIHAAADTHVAPERADEIMASILDGTRLALDFAERVGATDFLLTSSGAAYGKQPPEMTHLTEDFAGLPDTSNPASAYGEGKRLAEMMCMNSRGGLRTKIARLFAFIGPHLALDRQYAAGNFIRDAIGGNTIQIGGDGTDRRSYLYAADMAVWLWTILFRGKPRRIYNVGSEQDLSIEQLARLVANAVQPGVSVSIAKSPVPGQLPARYVPLTVRARSELQLQEWVPIAESIKRTVAWFQS